MRTGTTAGDGVGSGEDFERSFENPLTNRRCRSHIGFTSRKPGPYADVGFHVS